MRGIWLNSGLVHSSFQIGTMTEENPASRSVSARRWAFSADSSPERRSIIDRLPAVSGIVSGSAAAIVINLFDFHRTDALRAKSTSVHMYFNLSPQKSN